MGLCCIRVRHITNPQIQNSSFSSPDKKSPNWLYIQKCNIQKHYTFKKFIGAGFFGSVREAVSNDGLLTVAVKSISKNKVPNKELLGRELETLHQADHPNIIKLYEIFEDSKFIHMVMEKCTGGELFDKIIEKKHFSEQQAAKLLYKILHAVNYLHNLQIIHRDIKAENILLSSTDKEAEVKLIDFGLAHKFGKNEHMHSMVGTPYYVAPEVLQKDYGQECDLWSVGVLTYFLLSGHPPFCGENPKEVFIKILTEEPSYEDKSWAHISPEAISFTKSLLCKDINARASAAKAMEHPWFSANFSQSPLSTHSKILRRIAKYKKNSELRAGVLNVMSRHLSTHEINELNQLFRAIDRDHSGYIALDDLQEALKTYPNSNALQVFQNLNISDDRIYYSQFLTAAMDRRVLMDIEARWMAFKFFDIEDTGHITLDNLQAALEKLDVWVSHDQALKMVQEAGIKYDKWIDFQEFSKLLTPLTEEIASTTC